jgi:hypothetical protein
VIVLFYIGTTEAVNNSSDADAEEDTTTEEVVTDDGYDITYDSNGNMTPESMENIANQELNKGANEIPEEEQQNAFEMLMEEEAAQDDDPPTGAKPW